MRRKISKNTYFPQIWILALFNVFMKAVFISFHAQAPIFEIKSQKAQQTKQIWVRFWHFVQAEGLKTTFLPHFFGFHAISPVFMLIWKLHLKFGQNYTIKVGARLGRTIFSALTGLLKIDTGRDPNLTTHWEKSPKTPGGKSGTSKTPLNTLTGLAPTIWCISDRLEAFSEVLRCPKGHFLHQKLPLWPPRRPNVCLMGYWWPKKNVKQV